MATKLTDEILSMMFFSDIHDNPMHPYRDPKMILFFQDKFPFNKPLGIDTSDKELENYLDKVISLTLNYATDQVLDSIT